MSEHPADTQDATAASVSHSATLGVVAIGRNEAPRLAACLRSAGAESRPVVYVDSGSTDGSVALARDLGAEVIELDTSVPFSAARARNAGFEKLLELAPELAYVQFVDGDCELLAGWLDAAVATFAQHEDVAVVCGRRRERHRDASVYNRLCDIEWDTPIGEALSCGGDAMMRVSAFAQANGFNPNVVAGEEPELCHRLRQAGWRVLRIDHDMTLHDAAMTRFAQWWRRSMRAGLAWAEAAWDRPGFGRRRSLGIWVWAGVWPVLLGVALWLFWPAALILVALLPLHWFRIHRGARRAGRSPEDARLFATHCLFAKWPQAQGQLAWLWRKLTRKQARLIEYKGPELAPEKGGD